MATQAWQSRVAQPGGGVQQPAGAGTAPIHWGAPGTMSPSVQGPPRGSYGPPSGPPAGLPPGPPTAYGQYLSLPPHKGPGPGNTGAGISVPPSSPAPPGSSPGMMPSSGPHVPTSSMQSTSVYGPQMGTYPSPRWQTPASASTPVPSPRAVGSRGPAENLRLGPARSAMSSSGPAPPGASHLRSPIGATALSQPPYQQFSSGPGPMAQPVGPWMPPPLQSSQILQRQPFSSYPTGSHATYPSHSSVPAIPGTGSPVGSYGSAGDLSIHNGVSNSPASMWGNQAFFSVTPSFALPAKDGSLSLSGRPNPTESVASKFLIASRDDHAPINIADKTMKYEAAEVPDAWTAHKTADGAVYYYNSITGQSTYEKPSSFNGEAEKVTAQPTPVSWERLNGTDWALVTTNDRKKYYYNTKTQATSWQVPLEVVELKRKGVEEATVEASMDFMAAPGIIAEKSTVSFTLNVPAAATGGREAIGQKGVVTNSALDLIKKKLQDSGAPVTSSPAPSIGGISTGPISTTADITLGRAESLKEKAKANNTDAVSSDSSFDSDDEDPGPTKEERVVQFKEMLKEKGIAPFSKWEKELPKVIFDFRFKAIPSHTERRSIFEHYVRTRADEERKEKRAAQKAAVEGFKQLLDEASKEFSYFTTFEHFVRTWGRDSRFMALDRKDREVLLNERVLPLRKIEDDRVKAEQAIAVEDFRAMLIERTNINTTTRWSKVRESLRNDPRYSIIKREEREGLFNTYVADLHSAEQEAEQAAKAKRDEEEKVKEREREMRKRKEREELEMERVRVKARRKDAITAYQALLTEKIKDPEASWTEARPKLEKDTLGRATNNELEPADRERYFREHTNEIFERCVRDYRSLLANVITIDSVSKNGDDKKEILSSWSEAKKLLKPDPRYAKMPRRDRESWWRRYAEDVQRRLNAAASGISKADKSLPGSGPKSGITSELSWQPPGLKRNVSRR